MTLHIINQSPYDSTCVKDCLSVLEISDVVVLIENGAYAAIAESPSMLELQTHCRSIFTIDHDVQARGLTDKIAASCTTINYNKFVDLCAANVPIQSWF